MALGSLGVIAAGARRTRKRAIGATTSGIPRGLGLDSFNYWRHGCPFINLVHGTSLAFTGTGSGAVNSLGWLTNMSTGQSVQKTLIFERAYPHQYVRPGNYVATWSGPMSVSASGTGLTNLVVGANRTTFTIPALSPSIDYTNNLTVTVTNSSGSPQSLSDLAVFHADDEADYLAGEIFSADFLAGLQNSHVLRFMDWLDTNVLTAGDSVTNFSEYRTEAHCAWTPYATAPQPIGFPVSLIGKLLLKTGKDLWFNGSLQGTQACFDAVADAIITAATPAWTGKAYVTYSNENWNFAQHILYLQNVKSVGLTVVDVNGNPSSANLDRQAAAQAHGCLQTWAAFEAVLPRERVVRVMESFIVNFNLHAGPGFEYTDPGLVSAGAKVKTLIDLYAVAPYMYANAIPTGYPADMSLRTQCERKDYATQTNAWYREVLIKSIDNNRGWMNTNYTLCKAKAPQCALGMYEGGSGVAISIDVGSLNGGAINYPGTVDTGDNTVYFGGTSIAAAFDDGERICFAFNATPLFTGQAIFRGYRVRKVGTTKVRIYANDTDYTNDVPAVLNAAGGTYYGSNITRGILLAEKLQSVFESSDGVTAYQYHYDQCIASGITQFMHFVDNGGWFGFGYSSGGDVVTRSGRAYWGHWGLKRSDSESDGGYPIATWFRALT